MKIELESTSAIIDVGGGQQARLWKGKTASGMPIHALIHTIAVRADVDSRELQRELEAQPADPVLDRRLAELTRGRP